MTPDCHFRKWAAWSFLQKLLHDIAHREGFGNILAEGLVRAGEMVRTGSQGAL